MDFPLRTHTFYTLILSHIRNKYKNLNALNYWKFLDTIRSSRVGLQSPTNDTRQMDYITLSLILHFRFRARFFFFSFFSVAGDIVSCLSEILSRVVSAKIRADYSMSFTDNGNELESTATVIIFSLCPTTELISTSPT